MEKVRTVLITGANKGLGFGMVKELYKNSSQKYKILLSARSEERGNQAVQELKKIDAQNEVQFLQLEIGDFESHKKAIQYLKENNIQIDVLVNNAGIALEDQDSKCNDRVFQINYRGTIEFTKQIMELLSDDAKILFISSTLGQLKNFDQNIQEILSQENITESQINQFAQEFIDGKFESKCYPLSKACLNAWIKNQGVKLLKPEQNMFIICPGWCRTDLGSQNAQKSIEEGISYPLELINNYPYKRSERSGQFYTYGEKIDF
ncbi:hypothetical protein PPERSA_00861 [Pseudocohnilembus persalinus]|uniref:NAD(P)-binding domain n=1 Tax=Pseudocohnilembus persalinus TaxID=266149 RepID=A0A0V0QEI8_PSEPJ|nr:hypothetical protein PPERSA_00861 [Pseudocohnilembus persalinus]|eukprot:KRX00634.1 hypothetical protein PPERSA_00861 [Pseudocohnilembus persalinus]